MTVNLVCRLLPHIIADGPTQMALDHALLDSVDSDPTCAVLRTYEWSEPTLSLGYFQTIAEAESDSRWSGMPIVRRMSGGGALFHDRELTYALVVPRSHPLAVRPSTLYRAVHSAIASRMRAMGIAASRRGEDQGSLASHPFLCFLDRDYEDVLVEGTKIVGSAQRRRPFAVLQHGSILLARSAWTSELPGLEEMGSTVAGVQEWVREIPLALSDALQFSYQVDTISEEEAINASRLRIEIYDNKVWTSRR